MSVDLSRLTADQALALTIWAESRGEPLDGQVGVGWAIRHRVEDARWPDTYQDVCLQPWQFSCWNAGDPNRAKLLALAETFLADYAIRSTLPTDPLLRQCLCLAEGILTGRLLDLVAGANHYCSRTFYETHPPSWAVGQTPVARVGRHVFFRL